MLLYVSLGFTGEKTDSLITKIEYENNDKKLSTDGFY